MSSWPFTTAELTAGLRRYFAEPTLRIVGLREHTLRNFILALDAPARVRGLSVDYMVGQYQLTVQGIVKEPGGITRSGLAGVGRREVGVYRSLASQLPMVTPTLIAADPAGEWLVIESIEWDVGPRDWQAEHYQRAVYSLVDLHERFWGLAEDLVAYPWLARPLGNDFEVHLHAAAQALAKLVAEDWPPIITHSADTLSALGQLVSQGEHIIAPLQAIPHTLLHGNAWPGSMSLRTDGDIIAFDWRLASVGPGLLDLVALCFNSHWRLRKLPVTLETLTTTYRTELTRRLNITWSEAEWATLWDCALLWHFLQAPLPWLAHTPRPVLTGQVLQTFDEVWLTPVLAAAARRLAPTLRLEAFNLTF